MNALLDGYNDTELAVIADFLSRTADAGQHATDELASG